MVRVPSSLIGVLFALALNALVFVTARVTAQPELLTALLPLCAFGAGLLAARWSVPVPLVPGFSIGLFTLAARLGLALGLGFDLLAFAPLPLALLELLAALVGGMLGTIAARRASQPEMDARPEYRPF